MGKNFFQSLKTCNCDHFGMADIFSKQFEILQKQFPVVSFVHSCRHCKMHEFLVTFVLYLQETQSCLPSLYHVTYVFLGPVNVHSSLSFLLIGMEMSFSVYTKQGVSEQNGFQYIFALRRKCNNVHIKTKNIFSFSKKCADTGRGGGGGSHVWLSSSVKRFHECPGN